MVESSAEQLTRHSAVDQTSPFFFWLTIVVLILTTMYLCGLHKRRGKSSKRRRGQLMTKIIDEKSGVRIVNLGDVDGEAALDENTSSTHKTICDLLQHINETKPDLPFLGSHIKQTDPYEWISYGKFFQMACNFGAGLINRTGLTGGQQEKVGIYSINCVEWVVAHYGLNFYSNVAVPLYDTLGEEAVEHIMKQTKMTICICHDKEKAKALLQRVEKYASLKYLVVMRCTEEDLVSLRAIPTPSQLEIIDMNEICKAGADNPVHLQLPSEEHFHVLSYTSGTTGVPKGAIVTHKMAYQTIKSVFGKVGISCFSQNNNEWVGESDVYLSFLPLAHILEQMMLCAMIRANARVGFYSGKIENIKFDMALLKPTVLAMVPRLLERIYTVAMSRIGTSKLLLMVTKYAVKQKLRLIEELGYCPTNTLWDRLIFHKIQNSLGGHCRVMITGSAACSPEILDFCRASTGAIIHNGYGATETCGPITLTFNKDVSSSHVGAPISCCQVKLTDVPDMDLVALTSGRGEICVKGPNCTVGYYLEPEKTAELIDSDGWLHTGDIGQWDEQGGLCIVDRCKNMFKLCQGEYVSPDKVENVYKICPLVEQVFLDGHSDKAFAIAVVVPNFCKLANEMGRQLTEEVDPNSSKEVISREELCKSPEAAKLLVQRLDEIGRKNGLKGFELAKKVYISAEAFSVENRLLTPTMKPSRPKIRAHYQAAIECLYR